ncbi:MAG: phosphate ABC transporter ATP-binding protein [Armatimonadetes bacterium]|nr:phosphate ABC transporter ATP-binding protein [Armatimonadota bacterium]
MVTAEPQDKPQDAPPPEKKVETRNLNVYYGNFHALHNVNLDVYAREILACIGPSGCGKSTFLRCLNRMNDEVLGARVEGQVLIDGQDIYGPGVDLGDLRRRVGMVFQHPNPFPMSVFDNVAYGPRLHGITDPELVEHIVVQALKDAALWDDLKGDLDRFAFELSGGQQQRVCIARALAVEPELLLMDEPCSALDPTATFQIEELMLELKKQYTIIIVTHNMFQASRVSDRTAFFHLGEVLEIGDTEQIFENPQHPKTDAYVRGRFG